jgi:hypothetical protein
MSEDETTSEEKGNAAMNNTGLMAVGAIALFVSYKLGKGLQRLRGHKTDDVTLDEARMYQKGYEDATKNKNS